MKSKINIRDTMEIVGVPAFIKLRFKLYQSPYEFNREL